METIMFQGSICALITPFKDGRVDYAAFEALIERHMEQGTHGLVPCGTTGESPTLSHEEHERIVEVCVKTAAGRIPVIAGAGSNSTAEAIGLTRHAASIGANAALVVTPYYNKPNQEGLYAHFKALNDCADIPLYIYNIPGRSVIDMTVDTMARLAQLPNIAGVKDATGDMNRVSQQHLAIGAGFNQLSGDDGTALGFMAHGGHGCISVTANVAPAQCAAFQNACLENDFEKARELHNHLMPLHEALFADISPAPVKYAASLLNLCSGELRLPLVEVSREVGHKVKQALESVGLL